MNESQLGFPSLLFIDEETENKTEKVREGGKNGGGSVARRGVARGKGESCTSGIVIPVYHKTKLKTLIPRRPREWSDARFARK